MLINRFTKGADIVKRIILFWGFFCLFLFSSHNPCLANSGQGEAMTVKISKQAVSNNNTLRMENDKLTWQTQGGVGNYNLKTNQKQFIRTDGNFPKVCSSYLVYTKDLDEKSSIGLYLYDLNTKKEKKIYISPNASSFPCFDFRDFKVVWYEGGPYLGFYNLLTNQKEQINIFPEGYDCTTDNVLEISLDNSLLICSYFFNGQLQTCVYNLSNKEKKIIEGVILPKISGNYLIYQRETGFITSELHRDVFLYNLENDEELKLSDSANTGGIAAYEDWVAWQELGPNQQVAEKMFLGYHKLECIKLFNISAKKEISISVSENMVYSSEMVLYKNKLALLSNSTGKGYWDLNLLHLQ